MIDAKSRISLAFITLINAMGLKNVTMNDVARQAGISKKTLYQHFDNKGDLVQHIIIQSEQVFKQRCITIINQAGSPVMAIFEIFNLLDGMVHNWNRVALYQFQKYFPLQFERFQQSMEQVQVHILRQVAAEGITKGMFIHMDAQVFAYMKVEQIFGLARPVTNVSWTHAARAQVNDIMLRGILTQRGQEEYEKMKRN